MFGLFSNKAVKDIQSVLWGNFTVNKTIVVQDMEIGNEPELLYLNIHYPMDNKTIRQVTLHQDANQTKTVLDFTVWIEKNNFSIIDEDGVYHNASVTLIKDTYKIALQYKSFYIDMLVKISPVAVQISIADTDTKQMIDALALPVQGEPTFMMKYGNFIMMGTMIFTQMFSTYFTSKQMRKQAEEQKRLAAEKKAKDAQKKKEEEAGEENTEEEAGENEGNEENGEEDAAEGGEANGEEEEQKAE